MVDSLELLSTLDGFERRLSCSRESAATTKMEPLVISPVAHDEHELLAALTLRAFSPLIMHQRVFGNVDPAVHITSLGARARSAAQKPNCQIVKATRGGNPVGYAVWTTPSSDPAAAEGDPSEPDTAGDRFPPGTNLELANELFGSEHKKIEEPHFCELHFVSINAHCPLLIMSTHRRRHTGSGSGSARRAYRLGSAAPCLPSSR